MGILLLQGPGLASARLDVSTAAGLWRAARSCGHGLSYQATASIEALVASLRGRACGSSDFVLLNPGDVNLAPDEALLSVRDALDHLTAPYIEIHQRSGQMLDLDLRTSRQPLATIAIGGDFGSSCRIAMGVALAHLSRCGNRIVQTTAAA